MGERPGRCLATGLPIYKGDPVVCFILREQYQREGHQSNIHSFTPCPEWKLVIAPIYGVYQGMDWITPEKSERNDLVLSWFYQYVSKVFACPVNSQAFETTWDFIDYWNNFFWKHPYASVNVSAIRTSKAKMRRHGVAMAHLKAYEQAVSLVAPFFNDTWNQDLLNTAEKYIKTIQDYTPETSKNFNSFQEFLEQKSSAAIGTLEWLIIPPSILDPLKLEHCVEGLGIAASSFFKQNSCNALAKEEITKSLKLLTHLSFIGTPLAPPIKAPRCPVGYLRRHYSNCLELS